MTTADETTADETSANETTDPRRQKGLDMMSKVYGWEMSDGPGDFFAHTCDQVFGEVWTREGLSIRDRRLLLLGALAAGGQIDVAEIQAGAALTNDELTPEQLEEIALFLCYYVGWPLGTKMNFMFGQVIAKHRAAQQQR
ncbi:carboxymuconolactone decarboxylase family protein [Gordonia sp. HNM0687]|uniref:Carboxymuconolactone decarboxylase family protein n=1 Tax=Gordonia mangrovi TaxID=2665643 RepID=A0A6L7GNX6_9ACTN|nr:carboxymuconolactone decarboxylase family protein [Gordonia mangrovi]MXP20405.1 carboxymuconolactone decarboxylase family protein [Gordonia mangrovi]UVF78996.1 carboxymuconolactone decarboxylase family protein [Gordonia mangrovi]